MSQETLTFGDYDSALKAATAAVAEDGRFRFIYVEDALWPDQIRVTVTQPYLAGGYYCVQPGGVQQFAGRPESWHE